MGPRTESRSRSYTGGRKGRLIKFIEFIGLIEFDARCWMLDAGCSMLDTGDLSLVTGYLLLVSGHLDARYSINMVQATMVKARCEGLK